MKKVIPINDQWMFRLGFDKQCLETGTFEGFKSVELPHNSVELKTDYFEPNDMRAVSTYTRELVIPEKYNGCKLRLAFEGADNYAEVYLNGMFVTSHKGGTPFTADITAPVRFDYPNRLLVKLDARVKREVPGAGKSNLLQYGGMHRKVDLVVESGGNIRDVYIRTDCTPELAAEVALDDFYPETMLEAVVSDAAGNRVGYLPAKAVLGDKVRLTGSVESFELWTPERPVVYTLTVQLLSGKKTVDVYAADFAFKTATFHRDGFRLNGKRIKLIGLNRIDAYPGIGRAAPDALEREDARLIKRLGCNCVRTLGLASKAFIDECGRAGVMVIEDFGGDGYIGDNRWKSAMTDIIAETVARDRNCPAVIAWGVRANNSPDCDELYFKTAKTAKDLDPSRAVIGARSFMGSRLYEDVFAFNERRPGISKPKKTARLFIPYIVSEHSGMFDAKNYDPVDVRLGQALAHLEAVDRVLGSKTVSGCFGMCLSDFNTARHRGSGDSVCHSGVTDLYRNFKPAAYAYMSQSDGPPMLYPAAPICNDEFDGSLTVFTNCDKVRLYRGESFVGDYFPDRKRFRHLKHPPVVIDDFIGGLLAEEGLPPFKERLMKRMFKKMRVKGMLGLGILDRIIVRYLARALKTDREGFRRIAEKYLYSLVSYRLEGVKGDDAAICSAGYFPQSGNSQTVTVDPMPKITASYETVKVTVTATDGNGTVLAYDNSPVRVAASGSLALVGGELRSFSGGMLGFYVRSAGEGPGKITVCSRWGRNEFDMEVGYGRVEEL